MRLLLLCLSIAFALHAADITPDNVTVTFKDNMITYKHNNLSTTFDKNTLRASNMIAQTFAKNIEPLVELLFNDLNTQEQINTLVAALNNDLADINDDTQPAQETIAFVNQLPPNDLVWLINKAAFVDIAYIYKALTVRLADMIVNGQKIDLSQLNREISYDINKHIDLFVLKMIMGNMLKQNIPGFTLPWPLIASPIVHFSPDGSQTLYALNNQLILYDYHKKHIIKKIELPSDEHITKVHYVLDGSYIIAQTINLTLLDSLPLINPPAYQTPDQLYKFFLYTNRGDLVQTLPSKYRIVVHNSHIAILRGTNIQLYDISDPRNPISTEIHLPFPNGYDIRHPIFSPDGSQIMIRAFANEEAQPHSQVVFYDTGTNQLLRELRLPSDTTCLEYSPDNAKIIACTDFSITFYDTGNNSTTGQVIYHGENKIIDHLVSPDGRIMYIRFRNGNMFLYDIQQQTWAPIDVTAHNRYPHIEFSPDSTQLLIIDNVLDTAINYDIKNRQLTEKRSLPKNNDMRIRPTYTPGSSHIFVYTPSGNILLYDKQLAKETNIDTHARINKLVYSPDSSYILIETDKDFMLYPTLFNINFQVFDMQIIQFLLKASHQWKNNQRYTITTEDEMNIYRSLDPQLQSYRLFNIPTLQQSRTQRIKDFFASVTNIVYRWLGWRGKNFDTTQWPNWNKEQSKEEEKEEDL